MAANGYRTGQSNNGVLSRQENEYTSDERYSGDAEKAPARAIGYKGKDDPFGDEKNSEVKYKTMAWW